MKTLFTVMTRLQERFKSAAFADMHRMASGMSGADLPQASSERRAGFLESSPLRFSLKRRQHLAWQRYICGGSQ